MGRISLLAGIAALLSSLLFFASLAHDSFLLDAPSKSLEVLEQFIDRAQLTQDQNTQLTRALARLKGGEPYLKTLHQRLWWIAIAGFGGLTLVSVSIAVIARREQKANTPKYKKPR